MDITDLGTRFGVDATRPEATSVHVLEGEVEAVSLADSAQPSRQLSAGQAVQASDQDGRLVEIQANPERFAATRLPRFLQQGTGFGLAMQDVDPNWRVVAINGQPVTQGGEMHVVYPNYGDPSSSRWLVVPRSIQPDNESDRTVTCRGSVQLPATFDANASELVLAFNADFIVTGIRINGVAVDVPENKLNRNAPLTEVAIGGVVRTGDNTVEIDIYDRDAHSALRAAFEVRPRTMNR